MNRDRNTSGGLTRRGLRIAIVVVGLVAIVGSGGDMGGLGLPDFGGPPQVGPLPVYPSVEVIPSRATAPVAASVTFAARATNASQPSYQWCRIPGGGGACVTIPGATGDTFTVTGVNLADDGARYSATLVGSYPASDSGELAVSPSPGVVYQDGEFSGSDWTVAAILTPSQDGPTYSVTRSPAGGNPGAYVDVTYALSSTPSSVRVFHTALSAIYDPATQGAIRTIDFSEDCRAVLDGYMPYTVPMLEQGGRRYVANTTFRRECASSAWTTVALRASLVPTDFVLADGPACGVGESCPDFSAVGAPIALGLASGASLTWWPGAVARFAHGFDNWRATVWRR